jgi:hypothetical protein
MNAPTSFYYGVRVTPVNGTGQCVIADLTTPKAGETPEQCLHREAAEVGWKIVEILTIDPALTPTKQR